MSYNAVKGIPYSDKSVNIARGMAIIAMVIGHAIDSDSFLRIFIYKWHMPLFFFFSGYFFDMNKYKFKDFAMKKFRVLYIPFIFWSLFILCLHNALVTYNINTPPYIDLQKFKIFAYRAVFEMRQYEALLGTFWFLSQLLFVNLLAYAIYYIKKRIIRYNSNFVDLGIILLLLIGSIAFCKYHILFYHNIDYITLLALAFFVTGKLLKPIIQRQRNYQLIFSIIIILFSEWSFQEMIALQYWDIAVYASVAICGIIMIYNLSEIIGKNKYASTLLSFVGHNSFSIMILHFASFKIVSLLIIIYYALPIRTLSNHPVISGVTWEWQVLYIIIGISVPLGLNKCYCIAKQIIHSKCQQA